MTLIEGSERPSWRPERSGVQVTEPIVVAVTDIVGSTNLGRRIGDLAFAYIIEDFRARVREWACEFSGEEFSDTGDGFIHLFERPADALHALIQVFRSNEVSNISRPDRIDLRGALHRCCLVRSTTGLVGVALNDACELGQNADPGEIWLSPEAAAGFGHGPLLGGSRRVRLPKSGWQTIVPVRWQLEA